MESAVFRIGPIRNVTEFEIIAEKSGYKFEKTSKTGVFNVIKLSHLIILASDAETGEPLSSVLISLSGAENYRSNSFIDKTGKIIFIGLVNFKALCCIENLNFISMKGRGNGVVVNSSIQVTLSSSGIGYSIFALLFESISFSY